MGFKVQENSWHDIRQRNFFKQAKALFERWICDEQRPAHIWGYPEAKDVATQGLWCRVPPTVMARMGIIQPIMKKQILNPPRNSIKHKPARSYQRSLSSNRKLF